MLGNVHVSLEGRPAELLTKLDQKLQNEYGKPTMYVKLKEALYGKLQAVMLFWKNLTNTPTDWGFKVSPYYMCVANKMIDGKQFTVLCHVDDIKISHLSKVIVNIDFAYLSRKSEIKQISQ